MPIRKLSQSLINKIAAGEVIERPASVVKELMENAVDAGATRIDVSVRQGGLDLVRVADNGGGIPADELLLAVTSHATSKLAEADDLFRVGTLGFRGEALASIGEVSRLVLRSRTSLFPNGAEIEVAGGRAGEVAPCGCPQGTTVEVANLFYNTPVRRKFLRTTQTEFGHASEAFTRIALAAPQIHFTLRHNERQVFELSATDGLLERIARFFGRELAESLIWVESSDGPVQISGYAAHPSQSRSNNRMQYFLLNGRHIRDHALQHALGEAYRGLLMTGRCPIAFLSLQMPPEMVDVNVHPTKLEVRFQDSGRLYSQLLATLRRKFLTADLASYVRADGAHADPTGGHDPAQTAQARQQLVDWAKGKVAAWRPFAPLDASSRDAAAADSFSGPGGGRPLELQSLRPGWPTPQPAQRAGPAAGPGPSDAFPARATPALQVHNRYLVTESREGVTIIDQHALHERILYEQLRRRIDAGQVEMQNLLVPQPVDLGAAEAAAAMEHQAVLAQLGMKVEAFGGETILITGFPAMLASMNPGEVLQGLLERLLSGGKQPDRRDLLDDLLHEIACKAAVKAGDHLNAEEIAALLEQRDLVERRASLSARASDRAGLYPGGVG